MFLNLYFSFQVYKSLLSSLAAFEVCLRLVFHPYVVQALEKVLHSFKPSWERLKPMMGSCFFINLLLLLWS